MKIFEIAGKTDSELSGMVFGHFTSRELAEKGYQLLPEEIREETEILPSNLELNSIEVDGKIIDVSSSKKSDINWKKISDEYPETEGEYLVKIENFNDNVRYKVVKFKKELYEYQSFSQMFTTPRKNIFCEQVYPPHQNLADYKDEKGRFYKGLLGHVVRYAKITK